MKPVFQITAYLTEDHRHSAYVIAGLLKLEEQKVIELIFKGFYKGHLNRMGIRGKELRELRKGYIWCPELHVTDNRTNITKRIAIDLQDWDNLFSRHALQHCDLIFKRAYKVESETLRDLYKKNHLKPFGPNHSVSISDKRVLSIWKKVQYQQLFLKALTNPKKFFHKLTEMLRSGEVAPQSSRDKDHRTYKRFTPPSDPYIFFQVAYHDWGSNEEAKSLNQQRAELIRGMKAAFGEQFVGGMFFHGDIPSDYRDCLTDVDPTPTNYRMFVQSATIVISTNGFGQSIPWKLMEYMQWGCCIVTEKLVHSFREEMFQPCFLEFTHIYEAVEQCKLLLGDENMRRKLANQGKQYYIRHIEPSASLLEVLNASFS